MFLQESNFSKLPSFANLYPEELWIQIDKKTQTRAEELSQTYSSPPFSDRVYLNKLARSCLLKELKKQTDDEEIQIGVNPTNQNNYENSVAIWTFIGGSDLEIQIKGQNETFKKRLILIPLDLYENGELFSIPREWVDLENWSGHYYLSVHVDVEEGWLRVRGFTTHKQLKQKADYNPYNYRYELLPEQLINDFSVLSLSLKLTPDAKQQSTSEKHLILQSEMINQENLEIEAEEEAKTILSEWKTHFSYPPRMSMDFEKWARFIQQPRQLEKLYKKGTYSNNKIIKILQESQEDCIKNLQKFLETQEYAEDIFVYLRQQIQDFPDWKNQQELKNKLSNSLTTFLQQLSSAPTNLMEARSQENDFSNVAEQISGEISELYNNVSRELWSPKKWMNQGAPKLVSGWKEIYTPVIGGAKARGDEEETSSSIKGFQKELVINNKIYTIELICRDADRNIWTFQLKPSECETIPEGMKLILVQDNLETFEGNEAIASSEDVNLLIDVELAPGEGLIWKTEPIPDNYQPEVLWF